MPQACLSSCQIECPLKDTMLLHDIQFTQGQLEKSVDEANVFHKKFLEECIVEESKGLINPVMPDWAVKLLRKKTVPQAVIEKIGSRAFVKRNPQDETPFLSYVEKQFTAQAPLLFRVAFGPLKNIRCCGSQQSPDLAEYLTFIQLSRAMQAVATVYPHGVKVQIVPDDLRALEANRCTQCYVHCYIGGLQQMVKLLSFDRWMSVEFGQTDLFARYNVPSYFAEAEKKVQEWRVTNPEAFNARWETALDNARKNFNIEIAEDTDEAVQEAAWRYLVAHQSEILSGMWTPEDAFPLFYANHPGYQLYSIGHKRTKLPWQISLPMSLIESATLRAAA